MRRWDGRRKLKSGERMDGGREWESEQEGWDIGGLGESIKGSKDVKLQLGVLSYFYYTDNFQCVFNKFWK